MDTSHLQAEDGRVDALEEGGAATRVGEAEFVTLAGIDVIIDPNDVARRVSESRCDSEEHQCHPLLLYFFFWVSPMMARGWARFKAGRSLTQADLLRLPRTESSQRGYDSLMGAIATWRASHQEEKSLNVILLLMKVYQWDLFLGMIWRLVQDAFTIGSPFLLREVINWMGRYALYGPEEATRWKGIVFAISLAANQFVVSIATNAQLFYGNKTFSRMRSATAMAIYEKVLRLDTTGIPDPGKVQQMHISDTYKFVDLGISIQSLWATPLVVIAALISLYIFSGWAGLLSIAVLLVVTPLQAYWTKAMMFARTSAISFADARINAISELCQGIRVIKFMCWEIPIRDNILRLREPEVVQYEKVYLFRSCLLTFMFGTPMLVSLVVFGCAYAFGHPITPENVFPTMAMINVMRGVLTQLPLTLGRLVDANVGARRIGEFLLLPERKPYLRPLDVGDAGGDVIVVKEATVQYEVSRGGERRHLMGPISLRIPRGKLTLIIGPTGSGKSTLMSLMIGESVLADDGGEVWSQEGVAYLPQEAWVMNATLRDNIVMGRPFDMDRYLEAVSTCQLIPDLHQLDQSDMTEIGERGINVSGGQKQRIAFARAVYSGQDVILMDDPLSAVDAHVCAALFSRCVCGALEGRTRVLITHHLSFAPQADNIIVVADCKIAFQGTYDELLRAPSHIASVLEQCRKEEEEEEEEGEEEGKERQAKGKEAAVPCGGGGGGPEPAARDGVDVEARRPIIPPPKGSTAPLMSEEGQVVGVVQRETVLWYGRKQGILLVVATAIAFTVARLVGVLSELMLSWWTAHTPVLGRPLTEQQYIMYFGILSAASVLAMGLQQIPFNQSMRRSALYTHSAMLQRVLFAPSWFFDTTPTGRIISRFSKDQENMDVNIPFTLIIFYQLVFNVLGSIGIMGYSLPYILIALAVLLVLFGAIYVYYTATNRAQKRLESIARTPMASIMNETLGGISIIRAYNMVGHYRQRHSAANDNSSASTYSWRATQRWLSVRVQTIGCLIVLIAGVLFCGVLQTYSPSARLTSLPVMSLALTNAISLAQMLAFLTMMGGEVESALNGVERVKEFSEDLPQERNVEYAVEAGAAAVAATGAASPAGDAALAEEGHSAAGRRPPPPDADWPRSGDLTFEHASLRYRPDLPLVLRDITMHIPSGSKVGVVGRTGSGKSSLMLAIFRIVELCEGRMLYDGRDVATLKMVDLRSKITIIPQDPLLFKGTIRSNVDPFSQSTDERVWSVLDQVGLRDRVASSGEGLACPVSARGANLSVGQRQLVCLARALLKRSRVLLLDEATASVDFDCDARIQDTIRTAFADCTVITIAHRLHTIMDADLVAVLDHGLLREFDAPYALLAHRPDGAPASAFADMVDAMGDEQRQLLTSIAKQHYDTRHHGPHGRR